jgi:CxxC-x17-CxxC domain-containing protein
MKSTTDAKSFPEHKKRAIPIRHHADVFIILAEIFELQIKSCKSKKMEKKSYGGPKSFGPREMTKTVCSDCGKECEVPFKPTEGRPVYCRDCLPKHRKPRY